jgi:fatty acid CoA ligase FadD9
VDRRNNVLKLSQGEFVTVSKLEAAYGGHPSIRQIFVYGNSAQSYLLAVIVPTDDTLESVGGDVAAVKPLLSDALQSIGREAGLQSYEIPRDFMVETTPFTLENGLLTGIRKLARPKLKEHYGPALEQLYSDLAEGQAEVLRALRRDGADLPALETVSRAAGALLGATTSDVSPDAAFTDLGGDSLSALTFGNLLREIRRRRAGGRDCQPGKRPRFDCGIHRLPARRWDQAADIRFGARSRRDRGARE